MFTTDILSLIPQKPPFVMVDKLLFCDEHFTQTSFRVDENNILVVNGEFTEAGLMENIAQTAAARAGYMATKLKEPVTVGYIGVVKNFEVFDLPQINDELVTEVRIEDQVFDITIISGTIKCGGMILAKGEMNIFIGK